jgi:hypothetical protein
MIPYFYKRLEREFFEKDYKMAYTAENNIDNDTKNSVEDLHDIVKIENEYDKHDLSDTYISSYEKNKFNVLDVTTLKNSGFNFDIFYNNYFVNLTTPQKKIVALCLLGIRDMDIARLMETSQPYINLTTQRMGKKVRKMFEKKKINFRNNSDEMEDGE